MKKLSNIGSREDENTPAHVGTYFMIEKKDYYTSTVEDYESRKRKKECSSRVYKKCEKTCADMPAIKFSCKN